MRGVDLLEGTLILDLLLITFVSSFGVPKTEHNIIEINILEQPLRTKSYDCIVFGQLYCDFPVIKPSICYFDNSFGKTPLFCVHFVFLDNIY